MSFFSIVKDLAVPLVTSAVGSFFGGDDSSQTQTGGMGGVQQRKAINRSTALSHSQNLQRLGGVFEGMPKISKLQTKRIDAFNNYRKVMSNVSNRNPYVQNYFSLSQGYRDISKYSSIADTDVFTRAEESEFLSTRKANIKRG